MNIKDENVQHEDSQQAKASRLNTQETEGPFNAADQQANQTNSPGTRMHYNQIK